MRIYTKDPIDWSMLEWQGRTVYLFLKRKVDRVGILEMGRHGLRGLANALGLPIEVVEVGLPNLMEEGWVEQHFQALLIPDHLEAEEAITSPIQRQRAHREKVRAGLRRQELFPALEGHVEDRSTALAVVPPATEEALDVTPRDIEYTPSVPVTPRDPTVSEPYIPVTLRDAESRSVTKCHADPRAVTPCHSVPYRTVPDRTHRSDAGARNNTMGEDKSLIPAGFDASRLEKYWGRRTGVTMVGHLYLVAQALTDWSKAQEPPQDPNDLIERAVDAFVARVDGFSPERKATFAFTAENFCADRHWAVIQQALAGRQAAYTTNGNGHGNGNGHPVNGAGHQSKGAPNWKPTHTEEEASAPPPEVAAGMRRLSGRNDEENS